MLGFVGHLPGRPEATCCFSSMAAAQASRQQRSVPFEWGIGDQVLGRAVMPSAPDGTVLFRVPPEFQALMRPLAQPLYDTDNIPDRNNETRFFQRPGPDPDWLTPVVTLDTSFVGTLE